MTSESDISRNSDRLAGNGDLASLGPISRLIGEWRGDGRGEYPTIESFAYSETFIARPAAAGAFLVYEQFTDLVDDDGRVLKASHREAGVIQLTTNGVVDLICLQAGGRLEFLRAPLDAADLEDGRLELDFESVMIANDKRMKNSSRQWRLSGDQFNYEMWMATNSVPESTLHVSAVLARRGG